MTNRLGLAAISLILVLGACDRRWKGDHIEPLKPIPPSDWQLHHEADERAQAERKRQAYQQAHDAAPDCDPKRFRFQPNDRLTAAEAATLAANVTSADLKLADGRMAKLVFQQFDYEETPTRGDRQGVGTVFARLDTGQAVGGVLWAQGGPGTANDISEFKVSAGGLDLLLSQSPDDRIGPGGGTEIVCVGRFRLHLDGSGVLTAQGVRMGALR